MTIPGKELTSGKISARSLFVCKPRMNYEVKIMLCALWGVLGVEQVEGVKIDSQLATIVSGKCIKAIRLLLRRLKFDDW